MYRGISNIWKLQKHNNKKNPWVPITQLKENRILPIMLKFLNFCPDFHIEKNNGRL